MKAFIFLFCILFVPLNSLAKDRLQAGLFNIVPYAYIENKEVVGITPDIIDALQKESKITIETTLLPYKRMLYHLELGRIDFAIFFLSDYSESFSEKLISLYRLETVIIGKKGLRITGYADLHNLSLATPLGVKYTKKLSQDKSIKIFYVTDYKNAVGMLIKGNVDAIIAPKKILSHQMKRMGMDINELGLPYVLTTNTAWIQFSYKSQQQQHKKTLVEAAQKLLDRGEIDKIIKKYYSE